MRKRLTAFLVLCGLCMTLFVPAANAVDSFTALFDIDGDGSIRTADARACWCSAIATAMDW